MPRCAVCNSLILWGGHRVGDQRFCSPDCISAYPMHSVSTQSPDTPPLPCWFCSAVTGKAIHESLVGPNHETRTVKVPACRLCKWTYEQGSVGVAVLSVMIWVATLLILYNVYFDEAMHVTRSRLVIRLLFGCALALAVIAGTLLAWLMVRGFRQFMFSLRGAPHGDINKYPEIRTLVAAGYHRPGSLLIWLAEAMDLFSRK